MIDIHNHLLFGVDDGARSLEESLQMLDDAIAQGVTDMILTPHYRHGMFAYPLENIRKNFQMLLHAAEKKPIHLYLGCEFHVNSHMMTYLQEGRCLSLADSEYVLTEYKYDTPIEYIEEQSMRLLHHGYIPVIAHVERYGCFMKRPELAQRLSHMGALIQIDADSILGMAGRKEKKCCKKLLQQDLVHIVASDAHHCDDRPFYLEKAYQYILKKYGLGMAQKLFETNPKKIITGR